MTGKAANKPKGFDWLKAENAIIEEISSIPNVMKCKDPLKLLAKEIITIWSLPDYKNRHFAKKTELKRLGDFVKATRRLKKAWRSLDPAVQESLLRQAGPGRFRGESGVSAVSERELMSFIFFGSELVERLVPGTEKMITEGDSSGRRRYAEIRLVGACARVWEWRTGECPKSARHGPFAQFVTGVFFAVGIDPEIISVENTIRAWAELG